jgi:hypothetical protein
MGQRSLQFSRRSHPKTGKAEQVASGDLTKWCDEAVRVGGICGGDERSRRVEQQAGPASVGMIHSDPVVVASRPRPLGRSERSGACLASYLMHDGDPGRAQSGVHSGPCDSRGEQGIGGHRLMMHQWMPNGVVPHPDRRVCVVPAG